MVRPRRVPLPLILDLLYNFCEIGSRSRSLLSYISLSNLNSDISHREGLAFPPTEGYYISAGPPDPRIRYTVLLIRLSYDSRAFSSLFLYAPVCHASLVVFSLPLRLSYIISTRIPFGTGPYSLIILGRDPLIKYTSLSLKLPLRLPYTPL